MAERFVRVSTEKGTIAVPASRVGRIEIPKQGDAYRVYGLDGALLGDTAEAEVDSLCDTATIIQAAPGWRLAHYLECESCGGHGVFFHPIIAWRVDGHDLAPVTTNSLLNLELIWDDMDDSVLFLPPEGPALTFGGMPACNRDEASVQAWFDRQRQDMEAEKPVAGEPAAEEPVPTVIH
jgi:hypothetical protein